MKDTKAENKFDQLVYVRLVEACNMKCDHCFIPANPKKMSLEDCYKIPDIIRNISSVGERVVIQWHGGEPTLFGARRFRKVLEFIQSELKDRVIVHGIQTNLLNFDADWAAIYKEYFNGRIGVSWDYQIRHLRDETESFDEVFARQVGELRRYGVDYDLTITAALPFYNWVLSNPMGLFEMIEQYEPKAVHIEKITKTGEARSNWAAVGLDNLQYSNLLSLIYKMSLRWMAQNKDWFDGFSPLDDIEDAVRSLVDGVPRELRGCTSGVCDTKFHTIDANGYKFGCTALNSESDNSSAVGVVQMITPQELSNIRLQRTRSCDGCQFSTICNTGCVASTKVDASGECSGGFTFRQNILKLIKK